MWMILTIIFTLGLYCTADGQETDLGGIDVRHRYACVSADSCGTNMYSIECSVGEKIGLLGVSYGAKPFTPVCPWSTQACISKSACCNHEEGDCLVSYGAHDLYELYRKCSQAQQCGWLFSDSIELGPSCQARHRSNYVMADFYCVSDTQLLDVCTARSDNQLLDVCTQRSVTASSVHLHHSAILPSGYPSTQCSCQIRPADCDSGASLIFRAVDVRLQSRENISSCHPNSRVELIGQHDIELYRCEEGRFLHGMEDFHVSHENNVDLYLYKEHRNYPTKLWLEVRASEPGVDVTVTCGPRSLQTARRCPARPTSTSGTVDNPDELPDRPENNPTRINIDVNDEYGPDHPHPDDEGPQEKKNPAIAAILGGVAAGIVVLCLLLVLVCLILRKKNRKKKEGRYSYKAYHAAGKEEATGPQGTHQVNYYEPVADPDRIGPATPAGHARHPIYHQPWGGEEGFSISRAKPTDLAYATSEEIKVLIEKMEKDRQCINEGQHDLYPAPNPTYYRHIDNYRYRYSGGHDVEETELHGDGGIEQEAKSNASENSGTEHMGSEDSKVEADRHIDSDSESHKVESEGRIQTYYDGYESPRLSTFHPVPKRNSLGVGKKQAPPPPKITDNKSDDIPVEHAPTPAKVAPKSAKQSDTGENGDGEITLDGYREPDNAVVAGSQLPGETGSGGSAEEHPYTPVYDEIAETVTDV